MVNLFINWKLLIIKGDDITTIPETPNTFRTDHISPIENAGNYIIF